MTACQAFKLPRCLTVSLSCFLADVKLDLSNREQLKACIHKTLSLFKLKTHLEASSAVSTKLCLDEPGFFDGPGMPKENKIQVETTKSTTAT